jgi:hypothetical protein
MGTLQKQFDATADRVVTTETIPIDGATVIGATVICITAGANPAGAWVELGLMSGGNSQAHRVILFSQGYVGEGNAITWQGQIIGKGEQYVYANVRSTDANEFKLTILTEAK